MPRPERPPRLTRQSIAAAAEELASRDRSLAPVWKQFGPPPLLHRPATLGTLVQIILEQQVSVASAQATYRRFRDACDGRVTAADILALGADRLRDLGFSRQKARYALALADDCRRGAFKVGSLRHLDDDAVREQIVARLGFGAWSADVFLMMALLRPDVFPVGDLGLVKGIEEIDETRYASPAAILERAETWRPYRSIATRMIWQSYVHRRGRQIQ